MTFHNPSCNRILILSLSGIGNLLMQTPLIRRIKEVVPSAEISVMVAPRGTSDVLRTNPFVSNVFIGQPKPSFRQWLNITGTIQKNNFDTGIVTFPGQLIASSSMLFFGMVKNKIGHNYNYKLLKNSRLFLNHGIPVKPVHDVEQNLNLLSPLRIATAAEKTEYDFPLSKEDYQNAEKYLFERGITSINLIGIHPGTNKDLVYKRWPEDRWSVLADKLTEQYGAEVLIFGGPDEKHLKNIIAQKMRQKSHTVDLPLRATAALMSKCRLFVSNDSGLMHIAVSQKVPTFGLFGPTDERRTAPWGKFGHVIRAEGTKPNYNVANLKEISKEQKPDNSLLSLGVDYVFRSITNY